MLSYHLLSCALCQLHVILSSSVSWQIFNFYKHIYNDIMFFSPFYLLGLDLDLKIFNLLELFPVSDSDGVVLHFSSSMIAMALFLNNQLFFRVLAFPMFQIFGFKKKRNSNLFKLSILKIK